MHTCRLQASSAAERGAAGANPTAPPPAAATCSSLLGGSCLYEPIREDPLDSALVPLGAGGSLWDAFMGQNSRRVAGAQDSDRNALFSVAVVHVRPGESLADAVQRNAREAAESSELSAHSEALSQGLSSADAEVRATILDKSIDFQGG